MNTDVSVAAAVVIIATDVMDITCIRICRSNNKTTNASPSTSICNRRDTTAAARAATLCSEFQFLRNCFTTDQFLKNALFMTLKSTHTIRRKKSAKLFPPQRELSDEVTATAATTTTTKIKRTRCHPTIDNVQGHVHASVKWQPNLVIFLPNRLIPW